MDKHEVAAVLDEIATLLELQGENPFRAGAYSRAARAVNQLENNLADVVKEDKLGDIPGIGETLREKITTLVTTGQLPFYDDLKKKTPAGLIAMLRLPSIGPKKIKALYEQLHIDDLQKLKAACEADQIAGLKGFGKKTQEKILGGIAFLDQMGERVRIDQALYLADSLIEQLKKALDATAPKAIQRLEICGSLRRRRETIKDIDLLVSTKEPAVVMQAFVSLPVVQKIIGQGDTKASIVVAGFDEGGQRVMMNADLRAVSDEQFPFALNYFTGSKEHNVALRQRAIDYGLKLNEYELVGPKKKVHAKEEADIYKALDLDYVPPPLREDTGEIAAAAGHTLPALLEEDDLQGVFHCHSTWSDGRATLEEMAQSAHKLGYKYLGIADHSQSLTVANGLTPERVQKQQEEIDELNAKLKGIHLFKGTECDILADGSLDFDDSVLKTFDYVVASVHSHFNQAEEEMTQRILSTLRNPFVTMLGHATGRLLLRRDGYKVNLDAVIKEAAQLGKMIEINANPYRLELDWIHCKRAKALGVTIVINPDAHSANDINLTRFGVDVARRGWLEKKDIFNTKSLAQVKKALKVEFPVQFFATCARGLEDILAQELRDLSASQVEVGRGGVQFAGDMTLLYQANLELRTAIRVLRPILKEGVQSTDELYETVRALDWSAFMTPDHTLAVDANVRDSRITHSQYAARRVKDAICDQFVDKTGRRPSVDVEEPMVGLNLHIHADEMVLSLDSSGDSLHKRGYRSILTRAPLNEALAAALILQTGWRGECALVDPLCGSGTFCIEGAWIALRRPPGLTRRRFGFMGWMDFDIRLWTEIRDQARRRVQKTLPHPILGFDVRRDAISFAEQNARAAGLGHQVQWAVRDLENFTPPKGAPGLIICNPPYGERLGEEREWLPLYKTLGRLLREKCAGWRAYVFSGNANLARHADLKPIENLRFYNGTIPCRLYEI